MAKDENRIDIGKLISQYEPLRPVFEALAEQFGILPSDLTNLSATGWSGDPFIRAELTVLIQRPERIKPERLRERAAMLLATANRLDGIDATADATVSVKVMTGRGFGVYVHRDPINPLQIGDCPWPRSQCSGHRTGLGGMPLLTVPDDQAVHVPHRHARTPDWPCSEIACHVTHGRPCRFCGGAPCRITPVERGA